MLQRHQRLVKALLDAPATANVYMVGVVGKPQLQQPCDHVLFHVQVHLDELCEVSDRCMCDHRNSCFGVG